MGGAIVLDLARELPALGVGVERIVLIDTPLVRGSPPGRGASADFVRTIRDRLGLAGWRARLHMNPWRGGHGDIQFSHEYRILVQRLHRRALADYVPRTPGIPVVVLKAQEVRLRDGLDARACFVERLDPPPKVIAIPGDHVTCLHPRNLPSLSRTLVDLLQSPPDGSSC